MKCNELDEMRRAARDCLRERDADAKVRLATEVAECWRGGFPLSAVLEASPEGLPRASGKERDSSGDERAETASGASGDGSGSMRHGAREEDVEPGYPARLRLVPPREVRRRSFGSPAGRAALLHALAHIEWNAVNLAWDAVQRFDAMPREWIDDWSRVAAEEALHFSMLRARLQELGADYGDLPAHGGLWEMATETADDPLLRMALVPRVLEARGLDVTPALVEKLRGLGDQRTVEILEIILRDEVGHVRLGSLWFRRLCAERGLEPVATFTDIVRTRFRGRIKGPLATALRRQAGFDDEELAELVALGE